MEVETINISITFGITTLPAMFASLLFNCFSKRNLNLGGSTSYKEYIQSVLIIENRFNFNK